MRPSRGHSIAEALAWIAALAHLLPLMRLAVPPGADSAMYGAMAHTMAARLPGLSVAWGSVAPELYPRGFAALIALFGPLVGIAVSSLMLSCLTYVIFFAGLRGTLLRWGLPHAGPVAALTLLLCKSPQSFFGWGGNSTVLALAFGLFAAFPLGSARAMRRLDATALWSALVLAGSVTLHPLGGLAALALYVTQWAMRWKIERPVPLNGVIGTGALAVIPALLTMGALRAFGPEISPGEWAWIADYHARTERVLEGPAWVFPWALLRGWPRVLGDAYLIVLAMAVLVAVRSPRGRQAVAGFLAGALVVGAGFAVVDAFPRWGAAFYPARFTPLFPILAAPVFARAIERLAGGSPANPTPPFPSKVPVASGGWRERARRGAVGLAGLAVIGVAVARHVHGYQSRRALADRAELALFAEVASALSRESENQRARGPANRRADPFDGAVLPRIAGAYAGPAQWIPACLGWPIDEPHVHISLRDEVLLWTSSHPPTHLLDDEHTGAAVPAGARKVAESAAGRVWALP